MFAKTIIDSDAFLEMSRTAQLLYFHLSMRADDDGFVNKPKSIMRMIGATDDDLKTLFDEKFLIPFESGVVVVKHWKIHNYIRKDTYTETKYKEEKSTLELDENNAYRLSTDVLLQLRDESVTGSSTQVRLGKDSIELGKDSIGEGSCCYANNDNNTRTIPPLIEDVRAYCNERNNGIDPEQWYDYYASKGWMIGKNKMKDWKAAIRTWERNESNNASCRKSTGIDFRELWDAERGAI